jgi:hypothetical protein
VQEVTTVLTVLAVLLGLPLSASRYFQNAGCPAQCSNADSVHCAAQSGAVAERCGAARHGTARKGGRAPPPAEVTAATVQTDSAEAI